MKRVLLFGTFDFIHIGHIHALSEAKKHGDELVVVVARDVIVQQLKGRPPIHAELERKQLVEQLHIADLVVLGDETMSTYNIVHQMQPDVIAVGYDQQRFKEDIEQHFKKRSEQIKVVTLPAYKAGTHKSSALKKALAL